MKKISLILFSFILMFGFALEIKAVGVLPDAGSVPTLPGEYSDKSTNFVVYSTDYFKGVRLSFIKNDGTPLYKNGSIASYDYLLEKPSFSCGKDGQVYAPTTRYSKVTYLNKDYSIKFESKKCSNLYRSIDSFMNILKNNNFDYNYAWGSGDELDYFANLFNPENPDNYNGKNYNQDIINLLSNFVDETYLSKENIKDIFLVIEPLAYVALEKKPYYGTAYEIALKASTVDNSETAPWANDCKGQDANCDLFAYTRKKYLCNIYLEGNLSDAASDKARKLFPNTFKKNVYFGNISIVSSSTINSKCNNNNNNIGFGKQYATGNYGVGMGVVWFYEFYNDKDDPDCLQVHNLSGYSNTPVGSLKCTDVSNIVSAFNKVAEENEFNEIDIPWYTINCGCQPTTEGEVNCTPYVEVNKCDTESPFAVQYSDSENWDKCIFNDEGYYDIPIHKTSTPSSTDGSLTYLDKGLGNRYCSVYCREDLKATFDKNVITPVKTGSNFVWPENATVNGNRTCKTKKIDWDQYLKDVKEANEAVKNAYGEYMLAIEHNKALDKQTYTENSSKCGCVNNVGENCCASAHQESYSCPKCEKWGYDDEGNYGCLDTYQGTCYKWKCDVKDNTRYGYYSKVEYSVDITTPLGNYKDKGSIGGCAPGYTPTSADTQKLYNAYLKAVQNAKDIAKMIQDCYTWDDLAVYSVADTELKISYNDITYVYNEKLGNNTEYKADQTKTEDDCVDYKTDVLSCTGKNCSYTPVEVQKCSYYSKTVAAEQTFYLEKGTYQYVLKGEEDLSNFSIHAKDLNKYPNINYINIGYANLPVSYKMKDATYDISLTYDKLGHNKFTGFETDIDAILGTVSEEYGKWSCEYTVTSKLIPEQPTNSGINVIYRPIDLKNPFPDIDAEGRNVGSNWCYTDEKTNIRDCSKNNLTVQKYITGKELPDTPIYSFTLTPSIIRQIRKYNKNNSYDDFKLKCEAATGRSCVSEFLTSLINQEFGNAEASGSCTGSTIRVNNSNFYGC